MKKILLTVAMLLSAAGMQSASLFAPTAKPTAQGRLGTPGPFYYQNGAVRSTDDQGRPLIIIKGIPRFTDDQGRPIDELGRPLDDQGRPIIAG